MFIIILFIYLFIFILTKFSVLAQLGFSLAWLELGWAVTKLTKLKLVLTQPINIQLILVNSTSHKVEVEDGNFTKLMGSKIKFLKIDLFCCK